MSGQFPSTRWTLIEQGQLDPARRQVLLAQLLNDYWRPLYVYCRRFGLGEDDAADAVQEFLTRFLEKDLVASLDRERGRLRALLRSALRNFLSNRHDAAKAQKRGGGATQVAFDKLEFEAVEAAMATNPQSYPSDPEEAYELRWALDIMGQAMGRLRQEFEDGSRGGCFEAVLALFRFDSTVNYLETAEKYELTLPQLKSLLHRTRKRYREILRETVHDTCADAQMVDPEVDNILARLAVP